MLLGTNCGYRKEHGQLAMTATTTMTPVLLLGTMKIKKGICRIYGDEDWECIVEFGQVSWTLHVLLISINLHYQYQVLIERDLNCFHSTNSNHRSTIDTTIIPP